jgi:hypothetical protein
MLHATMFLIGMSGGRERHSMLIHRSSNAGGASVGDRVIEDVMGVL